MKKEFSTNYFKFQENEKDTLYQDVPLSDSIKKHVYVNNANTTNYHIESMDDYVDSYYKDEIENEMIWEKSYITEIEQWNGEVISINEDSFDAILSLQEYHNKRLVKIKKTAVDKYTWKNMHEGSQFVWNFKTERTAKGTIKKNNQIYLKNELKISMSDIQKMVEQEMKKFAYLFDDD